MDDSANVNTNTDFGTIGMMKISDEEFNSIRKLVYDRIGINLTDQKKSLVVGRLQKLLRQMKFTTFQQYYEYLINDNTGKGLDELANRISTNHTFFYREKDHFDFFTQIALPEAVERHNAHNSKDLRIWCAAASSGEEPYTITISMMEYFGMEYAKWNAGLLATDISAKALNAAINGVYPKERIEEVPGQLLNKYFSTEDNQNWTVSDKLKKEVTYRRFNLMNEKFPFKKPFDIIFCRNVMIYFDQQTRDTLVKKFYDATVPGGYLFIGHSESLGRADTHFKYIKPAVYKKEI